MSLKTETCIKLTFPPKTKGGFSPCTQNISLRFITCKKNQSAQMKMDINHHHVFTEPLMNVCVFICTCIVHHITGGGGLGQWFHKTQRTCVPCGQINRTGTSSYVNVCPMEGGLAVGRAGEVLVSRSPYATHVHSIKPPQRSRGALWAVCYSSLTRYARTFTLFSYLRTWREMK